MLEHTHQNGEQKCVLLGRRGGTCLYLTHFGSSLSLVAADLSEQLLGKHSAALGGRLYNIAAQHP